MTSANRTTDITAGPGGIMTDEVGVVTGDLTVHVQYKDAAEWYTVTGGHAHLADPRDIDAVHTVVTGILNRPEG